MTNEVKESEEVKKYVNNLIRNQRTNGMIRGDRLDKYKDKKKSNNALKMDNDFYVSLVFQSSEQKMEFLNHVKFFEEELEEVNGSKVRVINGIDFAKRLGFDLTLEREVDDYPTPDLDLMPYVLDNVSYQELAKTVRDNKDTE